MGNRLILLLLQEFGYSETVELSYCDDLRASQLETPGS